MRTPHDSKKAQAARRVAAAEKRHLRTELLGVLGDVGSLVSTEESNRIAAASTTVGAFLRGLACALEGMDGTSHPRTIEILGALSDLARMRMLPSEQALPLDTPAEIVSWFATYLERTLDKPDLRLR